MSASGSKPRLAESVFHEDHHVCAFFHNRDEEFRTLAPFILEGLEAGEKTIHVISFNLRESYKRSLMEAGINVDSIEQSGQLEMIAWPTIPRQGSIDQEAAIGLIDRQLRAAREAGYRRTRIIGEMDWALEGHLLDGELVALEARLHEVYLGHEVWVICAYDLSHFSGSIVIDIMRTHPAAIIGGVLQHNPFCIPSAQMLQELRQRSGLLSR
jgi:hypothetical protein